MAKNLKNFLKKLSEETGAISFTESKYGDINNWISTGSYALNRIYTEYYRSRGYDFDITNSTTVKSTGTFWIDNTAPTITLGSNSNTTYAKTHSVTVTLADAHAGLAAGSNQNIKYGWSTSDTDEPEDYTTVSLANTVGATRTTFTATTTTRLAEQVLQ